MKQLFPAVALGAVGLAVFLIGTAPARAADPKLLITWKSNSLAPYNYQGKLLPAANSFITASVEALLDSGKLADLSGETVYWYANDKLVGGGKGVKTVTFRAPPLPGGTVDLRAELPSFGDSGFVADTVVVPVAAPTAVIEAPFPGTTFSSSPLQLKAHAYYFSVLNSASLTFGWKVNGNPPTSSDDPEILTVTLGPNVPSGAPVSVDLTVKNPDILYEAAEAVATFTYQK